ncbi:MAG: hypothetical protein JWM74_1925 [Myxococcaceae bacterium]|nr:hypothetical protein [Myxococcaceae bacterium]
MRTTRIAVLWMVLGGVGASALGCGSAANESAAAETATTAESAATKAPVATQARGPVRFLGEALGEVALRPAQRVEIEKLAADAQARHEVALASKRDVIELVATQIERGTIDREAFAPSIDAAAASIDKVRPLDRAAFERLHAILDHDQRVALVDAIEVKMREKKSARPGRNRLEEWVTDLKLAPVQMEMIRVTVMKEIAEAHDSDSTPSAPSGQPSWREGRAKGQRVLAAFKEDRFVLDEIAPTTDARVMAKEISTKILNVAEVVLPVLTPEQRTIAAAKIRARAATSEDL